jgi:hypothetical protein
MNLVDRLDALDDDAKCTDAWPEFLEKVADEGFDTQPVDDQVKVDR